MSDQQTRRTGLTDLPNELLAQITEEYLADDTQALHALCQMSNQLQKVSTKPLYTKIKIDSGTHPKDEATQLLRTLLDFPELAELAEHAVELHLNVFPAPAGKFLKLKPSAKKIIEEIINQYGPLHTNA